MRRFPAAALIAFAIWVSHFDMPEQSDSAGRIPARRPGALVTERRVREVVEKAEQAEELREWQERRRKGTTQPFDQPDGALAFHLFKRLPQGQSTLDPDLTYKAIAEADQLPLYSTANGAFVAGSPSGSRLRPRLVEGRNISGTWTPLGPGNVGGRTRAILIHPTTPTTMWAGGVAGGIWKTTNGGASWAPKADLVVNIAVNSMILDPRNPDHLYAGTGEGFFNGDAIRGAGILESTDGGETWSRLPSTSGPDFHYVQKIVMSRGSSQRIYAATRMGVFRTNDGGLSWTKVLDASGVNGCMDLAIQTDRPLALVFAACGTFISGAAIYRALDTAGTAAWTSVHAPANMGRTSLALAPSNQNIIYAMSASNANQALLGVYRSTSSGAAGSWTTQVSNTSAVPQNTVLLTNPLYALCLNQAFNQGWYDNIIAVDPVNPNVVWAGGIDLFRSDDAGQNWGIASYWWFPPIANSEYAHADNHTLVFHPQYNGTTNQILYAGSDGGIFRSSNARATVSYSPPPINFSSPVCGNPAPNAVRWTALNNGYDVTQFYDGAPFPDNSAFFGGTQDNGTVKGTTSTGRNAWNTLLGGDGGYVAVNPGNTNMLWGEFTRLSLQRSTNGGLSFSSFTSGILESPNNFLFIAPFAQDPSNAANMWTGGAFIWRATQATNIPEPPTIWTQASTFLGQIISAFAVAPGDSNYVYVGGASSGTVWRNTAALTANSTTVWPSSIPRVNGYVSGLAVDPADKMRVYATVSTYSFGISVGHVFRSTNGGVSWTNIDGSGANSIPDVPAHSIAVDPNNSSRLYVGTDIGVFVSLDGGANWARESTGFANVIVETLKIQGNYLYAFTHGRSAWRVSLQ
jgi:photosystem II stability/assembly factor-like uncharacterized protein